MKNKKFYELLFLSLVMVLITCFASYSFGKYNFHFDDVLQGQFVDFIISCDAEGQTAVLQKTTEKPDEYSYVAYIPISVTNVKDDKVSQRDIKYSFRTPEVKELTDGKVIDAWGEAYTIAENSDYYDVEIVKSDGSSYDSDSADDLKELNVLTSFTEKVEGTNKLVLKVMRRNNSKKDGKLVDGISGKTESFSLILNTSLPYNEIFEYKIRVSDCLIIMNTSKTEINHFGFNELDINVKTSKSYSYNGTDYYYPAKITFNLSDNLIFDYNRFILETENNIKQLTDASTYQPGFYLEYQGDKLKSVTFFLTNGSSINCRFYIQGNCKISVNAYFSTDNSVDSNDLDYSLFIAGINITNDEAVVYEKTA